MIPIRDSRRRRPSQSRARVTAEAIQQAFLQILAQKSYSRISIREVISLAGVGVGSFYEYFSSKDALAAICIRRQIREIAVAMSDCVATRGSEPLHLRVDALLEAQARAPLAEPEQWAAIFMIERQISRIEAFRGLYAEFVQLWVTMLGAGSDWPGEVSVEEAAFAAHTMVYSLVSQTLLTRTSRPDGAAVRRLLRTAVHGYLSVLAPMAYRLHRFDI